MSTVLWGGRRGDVQYGSRAFWRRNIPIDPAVQIMWVASTTYFDVGDLLAPTGQHIGSANAIALLGRVLVVAGMLDDRIGLQELYP